MNTKLSQETRQVSQRSVHTSFKSPVIVKSSSSTRDDSLTDNHPPSGCAKKSLQVSGSTSHTSLREIDTLRLQREVEELSQQLHQVEQQIQQLRDEGLEESELEEHIAKLHEYNEIKDTAQMILGHIATLQGVRTKDVYPKYGLELDD